MLHPDTAAGVHRIEDADTNCYLVEDGDRLTVGDTGVPTSWRSEKARRELGVPVYVHENDVPLTRHPWRYDHERLRSRYLTTQFDALPIVAVLTRTRAWFAAPAKEVVRFDDGTLPAPARRARRHRADRPRRAVDGGRRGRGRPRAGGGQRLSCGCLPCTPRRSWSRSTQAQHRGRARRCRSPGTGGALE